MVALALCVAGTSACGSDGGGDERTITATGRSATITYAPLTPASDADLSAAAKVLLRRLDGLNLADGSRVSVDDNSIVVKVPASRAQEVRRVLRRSGELRFRPVLQAGIPVDSAEVTPTPPEGDVAAEVVVLPMRDGAGVAIELFQLGPTLLTGEVLKTAGARFSQDSGVWYIQITLTSAGSSQFDGMAEAHLGERIAIVLDSVVFSAPTINATRFEGRPTITGDFTEREARELALVLRTPTGLQLRERSFESELD
jgi:preprotein translocase subunit SecD